MSASRLNRLYSTSSAPRDIAWEDVSSIKEESMRSSATPWR